MIRVKNLCKKFGSKTVLDNADIFVDSGSICGLVGVNGAGKSTLLRILSGIIRSDGGQVLFDGNSVFENESVKKNVFFLSDEPYYDSNVSGAKLKELYKTFYPFDGKIFSF